MKIFVAFRTYRIDTGRRKQQVKSLEEATKAKELCNLYTITSHAHRTYAFA